MTLMAAGHVGQDATVASWGEVREQAGELVAAVEERFAVRKHCTIATLRADGSPRISGIEVELGGDEATIGSMVGAVKARDLQRDPRFALHSGTVDPPPEDPARWPGEAKLAGYVVPTDPDGVPADAHTWRLDVREVVLTRIDGGGEALEITSWHEGRATVVRRRT
jgi:hypothetical protein